MVDDIGYEEKSQNAVAEVEQEQTQPEDELTFTSGVTIRIGHVPPLVLQSVVNKFKYPPIPEVYDVKKGRHLANPDNPEYRKQCEQVDSDRGMATIDAILAFGADIVFIPENLEGPDGEEWIYDLELVGLTVRRESKRARKLAWLKTVAIPEGEDLQAVFEKFQSSLGLGEAAVANAMEENFQGQS